MREISGDSMLKVVAGGTSREDVLPARPFSKMRLAGRCLLLRAVLMSAWICASPRCEGELGSGMDGQRELFMDDIWSGICVELFMDDIRSGICVERRQRRGVSRISARKSQLVVCIVAKKLRWEGQHNKCGGDGGFGKGPDQRAETSAQSRALEGDGAVESLCERFGPPPFATWFCQQERANMSAGWKEKKNQQK